MESENTTWAIANVFKQLDIAFVDDTTYKRLENIGSRYEYIDSDLLEQIIETELIIMLDRGN